MGAHGDDPRREPGLEGVHGTEGDDLVHRVLLVGGLEVGAGADERGKEAAEVGVGFAVVGAGGVGRGWCGLHEMAPMLEERRGCGS